VTTELDKKTDLVELLYILVLKEYGSLKTAIGPSYVTESLGNEFDRVKAWSGF
jgi:hypothetical protein